MSYILIFSGFRLTTGHRYKGSRFTGNYFQIVDNKTFVEGYGNICLQLSRSVHPLDPDVCNLHGHRPLLLYLKGRHHHCNPANAVFARVLLFPPMDTLSAIPYMPKPPLYHWHTGRREKSRCPKGRNKELHNDRGQ